MSSFRIVISLIPAVLAGCALKAPSVPENGTQSAAGPDRLQSSQLQADRAFVRWQILLSKKR